MITVFRLIIIICEGKSEYCYIQILSKYLLQFGITLIPKVANGWRGTAGLYEKIHRENKRVRIEIWCDEDVFRRNAKKPKILSNALMNVFNFEDFLVLHLDKSDIIKYQNECEDKGHFLNPMKSGDVKKCIRRIYPDYKKGTLPPNILFDLETIKRLIQNNCDEEIRFHSDFVSFLEEILPK